MNKFLSPLVLGLALSPAVAQVPCYDPNLGTNLALGDDTFSLVLPLGFIFTYGGVAYSDVQICSNGYVVFGSAPPGVGDYTPTIAELVGNAQPRLCPLWMDFNPSIAGSGGVYYNAVAAAGGNPAYFTVTWDNVFNYAGTIPHSLQVAIIDGGNLQFAYDANLSLNTNTWIVGASPGSGAAQNPVSFSTLPITTSGNATLHETGTGALPFANTNNLWIADALGGYIVTANACATRANYGAGCVTIPGSFYEHFPTVQTFDLSNTAMTLLSTGSGYAVLPGITTFVAPSGTAANLNLGDDAGTMITLSGAFPYPGGSTTTLNVFSNGFISTASPGAGLYYQPTPAEFLAWVNVTWAVWRDFLPNATNNVMFEEVGGIAYITWNAVLGYVGTAAGVTPSTFQFQFEVATGHVHIVFQSMDTVSTSGWTGGDGYVVGYSTVGASLDPTGIDISAVLPGTFSVPGIDVLPLAISASTLPIPGAAVSLNVTSIPAGSPFGAVLFGLTNPGIPLAGIGMPGCTQYTDGSSTRLFFAPGSSVLFNIPPGPVFLGVHVLCQGAAFAPGVTPLGFVASGGLDLGIGN